MTAARPWRAEVVGSLLRPTDLVDARKRLESGAMAHGEFEAVEDAAVRTAIELQKEAGIDVVTDGELRRYAFYGQLIDSFEGFYREGGWAIPFRDERGEQLIPKPPALLRPLRWNRRISRT